VAFLANNVDRRLVVSVVHRVAHIATHVQGVLGGRCSSSQYLVLILLTIIIDVLVTQMLSTESTHQLKLFKFVSIPVYKSSPLVHFVPCFFIKLVLIVVVFLLQFL
jgi:hypothetical protein